MAINGHFFFRPVERFRHALGELLAAGLAVPFLEGLIGDFALHEEFGELAALGLALEGHRCQS
jgi:hypothetical protein